MKWYSVHEFEPPGDCDLFCYCSIYWWDRLSVARYMYENGSGKFYKIEFNEDGTVKNRSQVDITHFCIPEPIAFYEDD